MAVAITFHMKTPSHGELILLAELPEYRVCAEDTDPRGWPVTDCEGLALGQIADLIVDLQGQTARYIVCVTTGLDARAVLIPTGFARLDSEQSAVQLDFVTAADLAKLPTFTGLPLSDEHAALLEAALTGSAASPSSSMKVVHRSSEAPDAS